MKLNKKMGFWSIVLLTINSIVGTGIFLAPGSVVQTTGTLAPVIFLCAAFFATILAVSFASASKYVNKSGAAYAYAKAAFGEQVGLYVGITRYISASITWGVMATAVVRTSLSLANIQLTNTTITFGFLVLMLILFTINVIGTKLLTIISNVSTIGKMVALIMTIIAGVIILLSTGVNNYNIINTVLDDAGNKRVPVMTTSIFVMGVVTAFFSFTGFESIATGSQDMKEPEKNLPRAIPLSIGIITTIYTGIVVVSMMLNPVALATSKEVVVLAAVFDNKIISGLIIIGALVSMFGINVAASFNKPRVLEAMAHDKQVPKIFAKRLKSGVPIASFILTAIIVIAIPWSFNYRMDSIIVMSSIARFVQFIVVPLSVITFYYGKSKEPVLKAKRNVFLDVILPVLAIVTTIGLLITFDWSGQFAPMNAAGKISYNMPAIFALVFGFIIIPALMFVLKKYRKLDA